MSGDIWYTAYTEPDNAEFLEEAAELTELFGEDGEGFDRCHSHEDELKLAEMSKKHPGVALILEAEGIEQGALWKEKYLDGKYYEKWVTLNWGEFEEKKLAQ